MEFIVLGSGTGQPSAERASPSFAILREEQTMLMDVGPGTLRQLAQIGIGHERVGHILISHFHPDHTADLIHFLFATRHPPILEKRGPFVITGPHGLKDFLKNLQRPYGKWLTMPPELMEIEELDTQKPDKRVYEDMAVMSQPVAHTPQSLAYRLEGPTGKSLVYSGDTGFCPELVDLARKCDLLILECSFPDEMAVEGHLTPSLAGRIATMAEAKRLLLVHFYPEVLKTDIATQCRKTFSGELILGRDFLRLRV